MARWFDLFHCYWKHEWRQLTLGELILKDGQNHSSDKEAKRKAEQEKVP